MPRTRRLAALDRRFLPARTPDVWRRTARRWRLLLIVAGVYVAVGLLLAAVLDDRTARVLALCGVMPMCVLFGYRAAELKAEDDRLKGRDPLAWRRPPGSVFKTSSMCHAEDGNG